MVTRADGASNDRSTPNGQIRDSTKPGWATEQTEPFENRSRQPSGSSELAAILEGVRCLLCRYVVFPSEHEPVAISLWAAHTHAGDAADTTPYLAVMGPTWGCGKTRVLEVLEPIVDRPWPVVQPSPAVVYHKAEEGATLLMDEFDAQFGRRADPMRAILDAGHRRGATVPRLVRGKVREYNVFGPKAIAGIGEPPPTILSRSIPIRLRKRTPQEPITRLRSSSIAAEARPLRKRLEEWAESAVDLLRDARPDIPASLPDRAADGWEPLLAIADLAGDWWATKAREAAVAIHQPTEEDGDLGVMLLAHVSEILRTARGGRMTTEKLLDALADREDWPWAPMWGDALERGSVKGPASKLARILRPFGIRPRDIRITGFGGVRKGYLAADFEDAGRRYLPERRADDPGSPRT
jgi:hypothetical protein